MKLNRWKKSKVCHLREGDYLPPAFVLRKLKLHESKHGVEAKLDQGEVPTKRLESFNGKDQLLDGGTNKESQSR